MPGRIVTVNRRVHTGWMERLYVPTIVKGLWVTSRHFFRNLRGFIAGKSTAFVVQYPEERVDYPDAFRGMPVLVQLENGEPKCVACGLCEFACPTDCITIVPGELRDSAIERFPEAFDIDMSRCMFCGLCEDACPTPCLELTQDFELSLYDRRNMKWDRQKLEEGNQPILYTK